VRRPCDRRVLWRRQLLQHLLLLRLLRLLLRGLRRHELRVLLRKQVVLPLQLLLQLLRLLLRQLLRCLRRHLLQQVLVLVVLLQRCELVEVEEVAGGSALRFQRHPPCGKNRRVHHSLSRLLLRGKQESLPLGGRGADAGCGLLLRRRCLRYGGG
jgi:hypothetical protein